MGPFWDVVFYENTSGKSKFSSKGAEFYSSIAPMSILNAYFQSPKMGIWVEVFIYNKSK